MFLVLNSSGNFLEVENVGDRASIAVVLVYDLVSSLLYYPKYILYPMMILFLAVTVLS